MNKEVAPGPSRAEVWSSIRYLDPAAQRGVGDLLVIVGLCWVILAACAVDLCLRVRQ